MQPIKDIEHFIKKHNIQFNDPELLKQAFIHGSYVNELDEGQTEIKDNERLEYLGDAVLEFIVSDHLYQGYPEWDEGELTRVRAALVRRESLAKLAQQIDLGDYLWLGFGEEESSGRTRAATLCDTFEAVLGAIHIDQGFAVAHDFAWPLIEEELHHVLGNQVQKDAKSRLQEYAQDNMSETPRYRKVEDSGPDHEKTFAVLVSINKVPHGVGQGSSIQEAGQAAAAMALYWLGRNAPEYKSDPELEKRHSFTGEEVSDIDMSILDMLKDEEGE